MCKRKGVFVFMEKPNKHNSELKINALKMLLSIHQINDESLDYSQSFEHCRDTLKNLDEVKTNYRKVSFKKLNKCQLPCLMETKNGALLLAGIKDSECLVQYPDKNQPEVIPLAELISEY